MGNFFLWYAFYKDSVLDTYIWRPVAIWHVHISFERTLDFLNNGMEQNDNIWIVERRRTLFTSTININIFASFLNISEILSITVKLFHREKFAFYEMQIDNAFIYILPKRNITFAGYICFIKYFWNVSSFLSFVFDLIVKQTNKRK